MRIFVFTPVYRLEPETVAAVLALAHDGPITWHLQRDNPYQDGRENVTYQYQIGRKAFLCGEYDAMLVVESDIIPPVDTIKRLVSHKADVAYGLYVYRNHPNVCNVLERYPGKSRNIGEPLTKDQRKYTTALRRGWTPASGGGLGCVLIKRHVLERFDFWHPANDGGHCDQWFAQDVLRADMVQIADMRVVCGHKREDGHIVWPKVGEYAH